MWDEPFHAPQPVSFSVSRRRAAASSSGGTCADASRAFMEPVEQPVVPRQVGAVSRGPHFTHWDMATAVGSGTVGDLGNPSPFHSKESASK